MRVKEAEKQFEADKRAHDRHCEKFMNKIRIIGGVIGSVLTVAGIVLFIVGANKSDHVTDYIYGGMCLGTGVLILFTVVFLFPFYTGRFQKHLDSFRCKNAFFFSLPRLFIQLYDPFYFLVRRTRYHIPPRPFPQICKRTGTFRADPHSL